MNFTGPITDRDESRACFEIGNKQLGEGLIKDAVYMLERAYKLEQNQETLQGVTMAALAASDWRAAVFYAKQAAKNDPGYAENWHRLGAAYWGAGNWGKAAKAFRRCLQEEPAHIGAHEQLTALYGMLGAEDGEFWHSYYATYARADTSIERFQQSTLQLWLGDYVNGWRNYEERHTLPLVINGWRQPTGLDPAKRWDGKTPVKHLLVYHEQGHGDAIQMARYHDMLCDVAPVDERLTVMVHPSLVTLFEQQALDRWHVLPLTPETPTPDHDAFVGAMSLPHIFGTTIDTVPAPADFGMRWTMPEVEWAHDDGGDNRARPRIALCTKGAPVSSLDLDRSCHDDSFDRLKSLEGYEIVDFTGRVGDYLDTARELLGCEVLVSVDTSLAHLAGTLGMPVFLVPPCHFEWRHPRGRDVNPWYPAWRYFRRRKSNDWAYAVDQIIQALHDR